MTLKTWLGLAALGSLLACATLAPGDRAASRTVETGVGSNVADGAKGGGPLTWRAIEQETELGQVRFLRDYDGARKQARAAKKPLFVLFDEVPG